MSSRTEILAAHRGVETPAQRNVHGKKFERYLREDCFGPLLLTHPVQFERIIDAAAAGSTHVGKAKGDFTLQIKSEKRGLPYSYLVECKASSVHESLADCFRSTINSDQLGKMRKFERAGGLGLYFFHSLKTDEIEIWPAQPIMEVYHEKRVALLDYTVCRNAHANMPRRARDIVTSPSIFHQAVLAKRTRE